jgi:hypothetical protein
MPFPSSLFLISVLLLQAFVFLVAAVYNFHKNNDDFSTVQYRQSVCFTLLGTDDFAAKLGCYPEGDGILSSLCCFGRFVYLFVH